MLRTITSILSANVAYPVAERLERRIVRPKIAALRRCYALDPLQRQAQAAARLADIVAFAGRQVPYYRDLFAEVGFDPQKLRNDTGYLEDLPFLTKDLVREHGPRLLSCPLESCRHHRVKTGGSTGPSTFFFYDQEAADWSSAVTSYARERIGASRRQSQLHLAARFTDRPSSSWLDRETFKEIAMNRSNVFFDRLDDAGLAHIWSAVRRRSPYLLHAHPSTIYSLAKYVERTGGAEPGAPAFAVFESSGEVLEHRQRKKIEGVFGCAVVNRYGLAEFGIVAYELAGASAGLMALESEGWFENRPSDQADAPELVITGLRNRLMPLIRYCTGDLAVLDDDTGGWRLAEVVGRTHDMVPINGIPHATHHIQDVLDHRIGSIDEFQIDLRTHPPTLRIVAAASAEPEAVARKIQSYWPGAFSLAFIRPDELIRSGHRAKFRHVIAGPLSNSDEPSEASPR